ncbi:hypothetical protein [Streptomyces sp. NPDC096339]|uniref:hypothetical protein n=1 Tax=Streptomyces sp. NPDC096339 TaxID=3366086 RepID=UPI0037F584B7
MGVEPGVEPVVDMAVDLGGGEGDVVWDVVWDAFGYAVRPGSVGCPVVGGGDGFGTGDGAR